MASKKLIDLAPLAQMLTLFRPGPDKIPGLNASSDKFPNPMDPVRPIGTPGSEPLAWPFNFGQNFNYTPRSDATYTAQQLQNLSLYPLARMCIENSKDTLVGMPKQVRLKRKPGESKKDFIKRSAGDETLAALNKLFDRPNPDQDWADWLRNPGLEDFFVGDYMSCLMRRQSIDKPIVELRMVPGHNITRYIDENGFTPRPPYPAYAQLWEGLPRVNLNTLQLMYKPRNIVPRTWSKASYLYGMSCTEQAADEIQIGINWLAFVLFFYTSGTMPEMIQVIPPGWTRDKVKESMDSLKAQYSGNLQARRGFMPLQGFVDREAPGGSSGDQIIFPKDKGLGDMTFYERHVHEIAFVYGTSATRLLKQMNRASAQQNQEAAEEEGTHPYAIYMKAFCDEIIQRKFPLGVKVDTSEYEMDIEPSEELDPEKASSIDTKLVAMGLYTINERRELRGDDAREEAEADQLGIISPTNGFIPLDADTAAARSKQMSEAVAKPEPEPSGGRESKTPKVHKRASEIRIDPARIHPQAHHARLRLEEVLKKVFGRQREVALEVVKRAFKKKRKADDPKEKELSDKIIAEIEREWGALTPEARAALEQSILAGIGDALIDLEISDADLLSSINTVAREFAMHRAAEMIGMRYTSEGELIENPNPRYAISETTRNEIRDTVKQAFEQPSPYDELVARIRNQGAFSNQRAELIARTETSTAQVRGQFEVWKQSGVVEKVKWLAVGPNPCPECEGNDGEVVDLGKPFPSGDISPLAHPNCYCILVAAKVSED